jgi:hypothetical protein
MCSVNSYWKYKAIFEDKEEFTLENSKELTKSIFIESQEQLNKIMNGEE